MSKKRAPCVVVSVDILNRTLQTLIVVPISSLKEREPYRHEIFIRRGEGGLDVDSIAQPIQIRSVDRKERVSRILGRLSAQTMRQIEKEIINILVALS